MRTFIIVGIVCIFAFSCTVSNEKKAQKLIGEKLKETLHDYSSYESVKFGTLDSVFSTVMDDTTYIFIKLKYDSLLTETKEALEEVKQYEGMYSSYYRVRFNMALSEARRYVDSAKIYEPVIDNIEKSYLPFHKGWSMTHSFRSNNAMGNKTIGHFQYFFDLDLTKINDSNDISESADE